MRLRTRNVRRKTTNPKTELDTRSKRSTRAPKMPGFLVEPVFRRTRLPVLRLNAENNVATETPFFANTVNNDNNHHHNNNNSVSQQITPDLTNMVAILVQAGWKVTNDKVPVYIDLQGRAYQSITKAFSVLVNLVQEGKAKRNETWAYSLVPKEELSNLIRRAIYRGNPLPKKNLIRRVPKIKEVHKNNIDEQCGSNEAGIQDTGVGSVEGTSKVNSNDVQKDDKIADVLCNVCGRDGDLAICESCQSTFHQRCLDIQKLPSGNWYCPYCFCKFCKKTFGARKPRGGALISAMTSCSLCEEKFHRSCCKTVKALIIDSSCLYFCGTKCFEIHTKLTESFGKKTRVQDGFSFTLLKSYDLRKPVNKLDPIKAECKPKLAKAFKILNRCFLPCVDEIGRVNIIRHLVYNQGSHFRRLNYSGFFTAILEKENEVISTATIRIHGNKLAEMPFVGTRIEYWGQGMCRRLLDLSEQVLGSFGVKELVIPSTEGTLPMWTKFGFKPLKKSTKKKMKSMSMAVFEGTTILQKRIPKKKEIEALPDFTDS